MLSNNNLSFTQNLTLQDMLDFLHEKFFNQHLNNIKAEVNKTYPITKPVCFISYAWGSGQEKRVETLEIQLLKAGVDVKFDKVHNRPLTSIGGFVKEIDRVDYVILVGTPNLMVKCSEDNMKRAFAVEFPEMHISDVPKTDDSLSVVAREMARIQTRLQKKGPTLLIPVCMAGDFAKVFPKAILESPGFHAQFNSADVEYLVFDLLACLMPPLSEHVEKTKALFKKQMNRINSLGLHELQQEYNAFLTSHVESEQEELESIRKGMQDFLKPKKENNQPMDKGLLSTGSMFSSNNNNNASPPQSQKSSPSEESVDAPYKKQLEECITRWQTLCKSLSDAKHGESSNADHITIILTNKLVSYVAQLTSWVKWEQQYGNKPVSDNNEKVIEALKKIKKLLSDHQEGWSSMLAELNKKMNEVQSLFLSEKRIGGAIASVKNVLESFIIDYATEEDKSKFIGSVKIVEKYFSEGPNQKGSHDTKIEQTFKDITVKQEVIFDTKNYAKTINQTIVGVKAASFSFKGTNDTR